MKLAKDFGNSFDLNSRNRGTGAFFGYCLIGVVSIYLLCTFCRYSLINVVSIYLFCTLRLFCLVIRILVF